MLILTGKTCSGKDTIKKELIKKHGYKDIVTYTTRPKRPGEVDGVSYHFITKEDFESKINDGFFAEYKSYNVANGDTWYYGSAIEDFESNTDKSVIILTPAGVKDLMKKLSLNNVKVVYIYANRETIAKRARRRDVDANEINRRMLRDDIDFKDWEYQADRIIYNNLEYSINDVVKKVLWFDLI